MIDLDALADLIADRIEERLEQPLAVDPSQGEARSPWMGVRTAAAYLDWPVQRLYKLTARGGIPHYKHEARLLFNRDELDRWLAQHAQPGDWISPEERAISH